MGAALDEACGLLATWYRFPSVTARFAIRFLKPVHINRTLEVSAGLRDERGRRLEIRGELRDGEIREYTIAPKDFGIDAADPAATRVSSVEESRAMMLAALENRPGAPRDIASLNAGASIYVAGLAPSLREGVEITVRLRPVGGGHAMS